ncbi:MAG: hypothetical protein CL912_29100 [Deltaproteobacteria bacterium]|nr:hypothetical protein [Deltaproteobacteria bacterium]
MQLFPLRSNLSDDFQRYTNLAEEVFYTLEAGATYETEISAAATFNLETGKYSVSAEGAFAYAEIGSNELSKDAVTYKSNTLELQVDGEAAKKVRKSLPALMERTVLQSSCTGTRRTSTLNAYTAYGLQDSPRCCDN